jgi:hypothetical protein
MSKTLTKLARFIGKNFKLAIIWFWIAIAALIAMPMVNITGNQFDGIDLQDLSGGRINYDFKFTPSLDFYGGSEVVYSLGNSSELAFSATRLERAAQRLSARLKNSGLQEFSVYGRKGAAGDELVVKLPISIDKLENFNLILTSAGPLTFIKQIASQEEPTVDPNNPDSIINPQPQVQTLPFDRGYITGVSVVYGADTYGYGIALDFAEDKASEVIVTSFSDINTDPSSQVLLNIGERTVAGQSVPVSSASRSGKMVMTTGLANDELGAYLIRDLILNPSLNDELSIVSMNSVEGRYDGLVEPLKVASVLGLLLSCLYLTARRKAAGVVLAINVLFMTLTLVAVLKLFNMPISLIAIIGSLLGLGINFIIIKSALSNINNQAQLKSDLIAHTGKYLRFNIAVILTSIVLGITGIYGLNQLITSFGLASFVGYITLIICLPITISLVQRSK